MTTPVLLKTDHQLDWPAEERVFYVLGSNGLHICRDHEFFKSCVPARSGPSDLERQGTFLVPGFPIVPQSLFERIVGFFCHVGEVHGGEAAAMLYWERDAERVHVRIPEQTATVIRYRDGYQSPIGLHYDLPTDVPLEWVPFADLHSHVYHSAYCSHIDKEDESYAAGLHIVVGRIGNEPPDLHVEAVADGTRFKLELSEVVEGYAERATDFPVEWLDKVRIEATTSTWSLPYGSSGTTSSYSATSGGTGGAAVIEGGHGGSRS